MVRFNIYNSGEENTFLILFYKFVYYLKIILVRLSYFIANILCIIMLFYGKKNSSFDAYIKTKILFFAKPQIFFIKTINSFCIFLNDNKILFGSLKRENKILKEKNIKNQQELLKYKDILHENEVLKDILHFVSYNNISGYKVVKLSIINYDMFSNRIYINYGKDYGISNDNLVVDLFGNIIGKIINISKESSEILLFFDIKSRFISTTELSRVNFIASGYGDTNFINIDYIDGQIYNINENETVYVKFQDNYSFPLGKIVKVKNRFKIKPNVKLNKLDYAIVITSK